MAVGRREVVRGRGRSRVVAGVVGGGVGVGRCKVHCIVLYHDRIDLLLCFFVFDSFDATHNQHPTDIVVYPCMIIYPYMPC